MTQQKIALTRSISSSINQCELTHVKRQPIAVDLARQQHHHYQTTLEDLGCEVIELPELALQPDAVFIEDTAIVLDEIAVITRLGAISRRQETPSVRNTLTKHRMLANIQEPATLEGGDVLLLGHHIYIGMSGRTNKEGLQQFIAIVAKFGYIIHPVEVNGCLHLKSAVTAISADTLLINPAWVDSDEFSSYRKILVDNREPYAANALLVDTSVIYPTSYPRTLDNLLNSGTSVFPVDVTELIKAEGAVTCCSIIFGKSQ